MIITAWLEVTAKKKKTNQVHVTFCWFYNIYDNEEFQRINTDRPLST